MAAAAACDPPASVASALVPRDPRVRQKRRVAATLVPWKRPRPDPRLSRPAAHAPPSPVCPSMAGENDRGLVSSAAWPEQATFGREGSGRLTWMGARGAGRGRGWVTIGVGGEV